jgi:hypothetical protein
MDERPVETAAIEAEINEIPPLGSQMAFDRASACESCRKGTNRGRNNLI